MSDLDLSVRLKADGSGFVGQIKLSRAELDKLTDSAARTGKQGRRTGKDLGEIEKGSKKAAAGSRELKKSFGDLRKAIVALGIFQLGRTIKARAVAIGRENV